MTTGLIGEVRTGEEMRHWREKPRKDRKQNHQIQQGKQFQNKTGYNTKS